MSETPRTAVPETRTARNGTSSAPSGAAARQGMVIAPTFCPTDVADPFDTVEWDVRSAAIKDETGKALFEQTDCEVPKSWTQLATNVVVSKYFYGEVGTPERERSVRQLIHRVSRTIADWGQQDGYFATPDDAERFYRDLTWLCLHQHGAFNSPVWFNVGLAHQYGITGQKCNWRWDPETRDAIQPENPYEYPQGSACFIQSVGDNMEGIMELARSEAMLFKYGSGTGTDLSSLRSQREKLSGGGRPSGPLSFMRVYDAIAAVVKSGGKTRRAAKMQSLKDWHPDILEFIEAKSNEEKKARALIANGYDANFNGEAYGSVLFQNANLSVRVSDEFMQAAEADRPWQTRWVTDSNRKGPTYSARELLHKMAAGAWFCGDPGVQYDTTINRWHTCKNSGRINASNPCVTGDTLVATTEGYRRIVDLVGQTVEVIDGQGRPALVDRIFRTGHKPVYELKTRSGYRLKLTADHRVWTVNRGDVPAAELTVDDVLKLEQPGFGNAWVPQGFGELVGMAAGDGCLTHQPEQDFLFISLGAEEQAVAHRLQENLAETKTWLAVDDGRANRQTGVVSTATGLRVGTSVAKLLDQFATYAVLDQGSCGKRFTDRVLELDRPSQAAILRGLFTADGTVAHYGQKSQYVSLDSTSRTLLEQVQLMLLGFGIKAKIYENRRALHQTTALLPDGHGGSKSYPVQQLHSLRISRSSRVRFEQEIGFLPESTKAARLAKLNQEVAPYADRLEDRVASLTPCGTEDVFDLTEPVTSHFVANGIVVHNCSEYMFLDDSACNLASVNLMKFRQPDGTFNHERFAAACRVFFIAQEILVDHASYPTQQIAVNSHLYRPLGLGFANLGSLLMSNGLAYDSDAARGWCGALTAILHGSANRTSVELARAVGPFEAYEDNRDPMLHVMEMHRAEVENINATCPAYLKRAAQTIWDEVLTEGNVHGFRNAQATVLAPTGTISFLMDCDTTGIEPDIALVKYKQLAGGGMMKIVNRTVPLALQTLGYSDEAVKRIVAYVDDNDKIEGSPDLRPEHASVFDCAFAPPGGGRSIPWRAHITMMAAAQPFLSGAISKTVNMPRESTPEDIAEAYTEGWRLGLKALAVYRDGSKESQPLNTSDGSDKSAKKTEQASSAEAQPAAEQVKAVEVTYAPRRERLPETRPSMTHKFSVAGHEGYITVGLYPDGRPGELFITMAKEGSTLGGMMDCFGTAVSMSLQYGVPLDVYIRKFSHVRFEPAGFTGNPEIPIAKSIVDYIFRWLGNQFLPGEELPLTPNDTDPDDDSDDGLPVGDGSRSQAGPSGRSPGGAPPAKGGSGPQAGQQGREAMASAVALVKFGPKLKLTNGHAATNGKASSATTVQQARNQQFARFQSDAPACDMCGALTVRNGNCYLCHECGNSMGCS